jgi:hypothetical protein
MIPTKKSAAFRVVCIQKMTICENNSHTVLSAVTVEIAPTAHTTGVVGRDPTNHNRIDGGRISANYSTE